MKKVSELQNIFEEITVNGGNADEVGAIHDAFEELGRYRDADNAKAADPSKYPSHRRTP